ncbi:MAG: 4Fe-4S binding protein [Kiritimatiellia bacterium]|jgi:ferredoxin|nr:4Fe-4S binding protein [Kiritimatiellia bacterium]
MTIGSTEKERITTRQIRLLSRFVVLLIAIALGVRWLAAQSREAAAVFPLAPEAFVPALSPFIGLASAIGDRALHLSMLLCLPVATLSLLFGRWFCRNLCHVGLIVELIGKTRKKSGIGGVPHLGPWLVMLSLGSAIAGYPLFLWMDPLSIFNGFLSAWRQPLILANVLSAGCFIVVVVLSFVSPGLWCYRVCPLGFTQDLIGSVGRRVRRSRMQPNGGNSTEKKRVSRRGFLAAAGGATVGCIVAARPSDTCRRLTMRPPGVTEERFSALCVRCGNCSSACPQGIISQDPGGTGLLAFLTPRIRISPGYCSEHCNACGKACPAGAIPRLALEDKQNVAIGFATVIHKTCIRCMLCVIQCPYNAITTEYIFGRYYPVVDPDVCRGCGLCEVVCPVEGKAIIVQGIRQRILAPVDMDYPVKADDV